MSSLTGSSFGGLNDLVDPEYVEDPSDVAKEKPTASSGMFISYFGVNN